MNLHGIVSGAIAAINPHITVVVELSRGWGDLPSGKRIPLYEDPEPIQAQVQPLSYRDLVQIEGLNLNGTRRKIYLYGKVDGVVRSFMQGGDLITLPDATVWLVAQVLEQWPDWCSVVVTLQNDDAVGLHRIDPPPSNQE